MRFAQLARTAKSLVPDHLKATIRGVCGVPSTDLCVANLKRCGFSPGAAIDVGAYSGEWTRALLRLFPNTRVLMIEPQQGKSAELEKFCSSDPRLQLASELVGAKRCESVAFYDRDTASSVLEDANHNDAPSRHLKMTTLDELVGETQFPHPDLVKLDVQGYELEVLKGAEETSKAAEVVLMEVNLIPIYRRAPLVDETISYMADRGFRLYDVGTFFRRPYDNALWQLDAIFVKASSHLIASTRWS